MLFHPGAVLIDCEDCKKYVYDLETGKRKTFVSGPKRDVKPFVRGSSPLQCGNCPKKSPENAKACSLSERNQKTILLYHQLRAGVGFTEDMKQDDVLKINMAIIDTMYREHDRDSLARGMAVEIAQLLLAMKK